MMMAGVSYPILKHTDQDLSYAQGRFISAVRRYLQNIDAIIEVDKPYIYPKLREIDITIMEIAATMELTPIQMKRLNQVRIHLGVMWVSEISTIDGNQIRNDIIRHQVDEMAYKPILTKRYQPHPNNASWKILDRLIHQITSEKNQNLVRGRKLGKWTKHDSTIGVWPAYTNINHMKI